MTQASNHLILSPRATEDSRLVKRAAELKGWTVHRLVRWTVLPEIDGGQVFVYGGPLFARWIAQNFHLDLFGPTENWLTSLPISLVNRKICLATVNETLDLKFPRFIKSVADKHFPAQVFNSAAEFKRYELDGNTPVLSSEPVNFVSEYRCVVVNSEVRGVTPYILDGEMAQTPSGWAAPVDLTHPAWKFAQKLVSEHTQSLPPTCIVDVGEITQNNTKVWSVIEANALWGAGLYGQDAALVLAGIPSSQAGHGNHELSAEFIWN